MQRLISLFHAPADDWPAPAPPDASPAPEPADLKPDLTEPIYFAELMAYVRQRNEKFRWPREGAD